MGESMKLFLFALGGTQAFASLYFFVTCIVRIFEIGHVDQVAMIFLALTAGFALFSYGLVSAGRKLRKTYISKAPEDARKPWV